MRLPKLSALRGIVAAVRSRPTPSWALPTCPNCRISMQPDGKDGAFICPKCQLRLWRGSTAPDAPLLNEGDHHGPI